jgi:hypothetical protein
MVPLRHARRLRKLFRVMRYALSLAIGLALLLAVLPAPAIASDGGDDVRVTGTCGRGASAKLRLKREDDGIELRFEVDYSRASVAWRVVVVHERRIAWKGSVKTTRPRGSFEVRRMLRDLAGSDTVTVRASGPSGLVCRAEATLPDS